MSEPAKGLIKGDDGKLRCFWCDGKDDYQRYHDEEWGMPVDDDHRLFEKICLEGFQSGLSWLTILRKRENFRAAFADFDYHEVAKFGEDDVERLVQDAGIVRHRGKIKSTINNAQRAIELEQEYGSLGAFFWSFETPESERPKKFDYDTLMSFTTTPKSTELSKLLKKKGWSFVGPTTVYAFMQAMGMVNDHIEGCYCRDKVEEARANFKRPGQ
ncbi:MAG: DNA-3-methyladenine glycosylase I [Pseudomonadota bacterium]